MIRAGLPILFWSVAFSAAQAAGGAAAAEDPGDRDALLADLRAFFETGDPDRRASLARQIASRPAFAREHVREWLHQAAPFEAFPPGERELEVPLSNGTTRRVTLRIPAGYDPHRGWPLLYALHGTGGSGPDILRYFVHLLGPQADQFVMAAPTDYGELVVHADWPPIGEHPAVLAAVRRAVNIDSNRVYAAGYSRGGHAAWTLAVLHAETFAGVLPIAGTLTLPEVDQLWDFLLPNLAHTPVLCAWGAQDTLDVDNKSPSPQGGIAGLNRRLCGLAAELGLPVTRYEDPEKGHGGIVPPADKVAELLNRRREPYPTSVRHVFRHLYQAQTPWIEGHAWTGPQWRDTLPALSLRAGEKLASERDMRQALVRAMRSCFGELKGTISGQTIEVSRNKISDLTIWIGDGLIDWQQPVTVKVSANRVFEGRLEPDLLVCLTQAARTYDFDRLRWAGLRFKAGQKTVLVTGRTEFPATVPPPEEPGRAAPRSRP